MPIIVTNATTRWDHGSFSKSTFREAHGHEMRELGGIPYPGTVVGDPSAAQKVYIEDFIAHMERGKPMKAYDNDGWDIPLYLFEKFDTLSHFAAKYPSVAEASHPEEVLVETDTTQRTWQMILGPEGSGASEHFHLAAINFMVVGGAKQWFITSPEISGFSNIHPKVGPCLLLKSEISDVVRLHLVGGSSTDSTEEAVPPHLAFPAAPHLSSSHSPLPPHLATPRLATPRRSVSRRNTLRILDDSVGGVHGEGLVAQEGRRVQVYSAGRRGDYCAPCVGPRCHKPRGHLCYRRRKGG